MNGLYQIRITGRRHGRGQAVRALPQRIREGIKQGREVPSLFGRIQGGATAAGLFCIVVEVVLNIDDRSAFVTAAGSQVTQRSNEVGETAGSRPL